MVNEISWWENELTPDERTELMGAYSWHGSVEERHAKLHEMRLKWESNELGIKKDENLEISN